MKKSIIFLITCLSVFELMGQGAFHFAQDKMTNQSYSFVDPDNLVWNVKISDEADNKQIEAVWGDSLLIIDPATDKITEVTIDPHGYVFFYFKADSLVTVDIKKADFFDDFDELRLLEIRWNFVNENIISLTGHEGTIGNSSDAVKVLHKVISKALSPIIENISNKSKKRTKI